MAPKGVFWGSDYKSDVVLSSSVKEKIKRILPLGTFLKYNVEMNATTSEVKGYEQQSTAEELAPELNSIHQIVSNKSK